MVTGKNKEQFEKWYFEYFKCMNPLVQPVNQFYQLERFEMQLGVYLAYYDSKGYRITVNFNNVIGWYFKIKLDKILKSSGGNLKTINEAYKEAFKEADKLMNK